MKATIKEAIEYKNLNLSDYSDAYGLQEALDYDGTLHEIIDGMIDIYNYDLRLWAVDNWDKVEEALEEGLCDGVSDYHRLIMAGQYVHYREQAQEAIEELFTEYEESL